MFLACTFRHHIIAVYEKKIKKKSDIEIRRHGEIVSGNFQKQRKIFKKRKVNER